MSIYLWKIFVYLNFLLIFVGVSCGKKSSDHQISEHYLQEKEFGDKMISGKYKVLTGLDVLVRDNFNQLEGKKVGLIINHTSVDGNGNHILDLIRWKKNIEVKAIFTPEHGFSGLVPAGEKISDGKEPRTGAVIYSLYGKTKKPTAEMLKDLDILVYDIQDIGARFYTYIWTMSYCMEAAAENGIPLIILDRPNPINGVDVSGPVLDENFSSFVGRFKIPIRHGMTVGELAKMFVGEGWIQKADDLNLKIIMMEGWSRKLWFDNTSCRWVRPSPNMSNIETAIVYPGLCLLEGTNVSEGRGTELPFLVIGAPYIDAKELSMEMNLLNLPGVVFEPEFFTPRAIPNVVKYPKFLNRPCQGLKISVTRRWEFKPVETGIFLISMIRKLYPDDFEFLETNFIDRLYGSDLLRKMIQEEKPVKDLILRWEPELSRFKLLRQKYLLYQ